MVAEEDDHLRKKVQHSDCEYLGEQDMLHLNLCVAPYHWRDDTE